MSGIIAGLAGAGGAANNAGGYYNTAMQNEINATGSPAAQTFANEENASLQPQFQAQDKQLAAADAAQGITNSGAGANNTANLAASQSATLAGAQAPLYNEALQQYGAINAAMPGAQNNAYQNAIQNFYTAVSDAGSLAAGAPPNGGTGGNLSDSTGGGMVNQDANGNFIPNQSVTDDEWAIPQSTLPQAPDFNPYSYVSPSSQGSPPQ